MRGRLTFEELDSYINAINAANTLDDILGILQRQIVVFGFEKLTYWVRWPSFETKKPVFISTYPSRFIEHYLEIGYQSHDMVGRLSIEKNVPFTWSQISQEMPISKMQKALFDDGSSVGLRSGGSIPLHGPKLIKATFSVANDSPQHEFDALFQHHRHELHIMASYAHERIMMLGISNPLRDVKLSPREAEVLTWAARGKTYWEIGEILSIQEDTVKKVMVKVFQELDASNANHAVSKAIIHGLIIP